MSQYFVVRQNTVVTLAIGPFIDLTAGVKEEGLTITQAEVEVIKNGTYIGTKNDATSLVHLGGGVYSLVLDGTDTDTVGSLVVVTDDSAAAAIPVVVNCQVIEEAIYDAIYVSGADAFNASGQVALLTATQASIDAIEADTGELQADWANGGRLDLLIDGIVAAVDTALTEPAQGNLDHTAKLAVKVSMILKILGNKRLQTAALQSILNSDEATVDHKSIISSDGTTLTFGELKTGP